MSAYETTALHRSPYPGLRPFRRNESLLFFGREEQTDQLLRKLQRDHFLAIVGSSGCGKSSLARAGMLAGLEAGFLTDAGSRWRIAEMRPGNQPLRRLAEALVAPSALDARGADGGDVAAFVEATLRRGPLGLVEALRERPLPPQTNLLLLVDQFEEVFRFRREADADEADAFVALLLATAKETAASAFVVLTMRSDFVGDCELFRGLPEAMNESQFFTPRMTREQTELAIVGPARVFGGSLRPDLVNLLLNEMGADSDCLPLLQHVLMRMWSEALERTPASGQAEHTAVELTLDDYRTVGTLNDALSNHADKAYEELKDDEARRIAQVMFRRLTERGQGRRDDMRRPAPLGEVASVADASPEAVAGVAEAFRRPDRSFLMPPPGERLDPETVLDISHESLIRHWRTLKEWADEEAAAASEYRRLIEGAILWKRHTGGVRSDLDLQRALDWKKKQIPASPRAARAWAARYGDPRDFDLVTEFLEESKQEYRLEQSGKLAASSLSQLPVDPELSVLLAIEAANIAPTARAEEMLRKSLLESHVRGALRGHGEFVSSASFSPDGRLVVTASFDCTARIWEAATGKTLRTLAGHTDWVIHAAFSPDGKWVITTGADQDRRALLWEAGTGTLAREFSGHQYGVNRAAFSPDGRLIVTASADKTARIWEAATGQMLRALSGHTEIVRSAAFSPDGRLVVTASGDKTARIWEADTGRCVTILRRHRNWVNDAAFSPDGRHVVTACQDAALRMWSVATGKLIAEAVGHKDWVEAAAFNPAGGRLITVSFDQTARLWDVSTRQSLIELVELRGHRGAVTGGGFSPDGKYAVTASADTTARIWEVRLGRKLCQHKREVNNAAFSPDGRWVVTASGDRTARISDIKTGGTITTLSGHKDWVGTAMFDSSGKRVVTAGGGYRDKTARIWEVISGKEVQKLRGHRELVNSAAFSPDGKWVVTASFDCTARIWEAATGKTLRTLAGHTDWVIHAAFSPDGKWVVTTGANQDKRALLWEAGTGTLLREFSGHLSGVNRAAFSPDGRLVVTASADNTARIWEAATGQMLRALSGHTEIVRSAAFSPDGRLVVTASGDKTARIWEVESGKQVDELRGHTDGLNSAAFNNEGKLVVTASFDNTAMIFDVEVSSSLEGMLAHAHTHVTRELTEEERNRYLEGFFLDVL